MEEKNRLKISLVSLPLYTLSLDNTLNLQSSANKDEILSKARGHIIAQTELVGVSLR
ncbi:MAG: hypothetical protein NTX46_05970 [Chloroflexi bacterium]|nr:hypothetical protein [Chloroflexota bacterium]